VELHFSAAVDAYAAATLGFLDADPRSRSVLRGVIDTARHGAVSWTAPPSFWWADDGGEVVAAASWTPPYCLLVSTLSAEVAGALVDSARQRSVEIDQVLPGVAGPRAAAQAVARAWRRATGRTTIDHLSQLLHVLKTLREPPRPAGQWRRAGVADIGMCADWLVAFSAEAGVTAGGDPHALTSRTVESGRLFLWEAGVSPVSMVANSPVVAGVVRVGPVYTLPQHRNRGYGRRLTYEVTREALAAWGATTAVLYTDLANPVSNSIYRQIGFEPFQKHAEIHFDG
jgi:GNAT superfamily N-acetyltransferase